MTMRDETVDKCARDARENACSRVARWGDCVWCEDDRVDLRLSANGKVFRGECPECKRVHEEEA